MTPAQIQQFLATIQPTLAKLRNDIADHSTPVDTSNWQGIIRGTAVPTSAQALRTVTSSTFNFSNSTGSSLTLAEVDGAASVSPAVVKGCPTLGCVGAPLPPPVHASVDFDQDGLPDALEAQIADQFTPLYASSTGEQQQFATLGNYVPLTITSLVGTVPPYSYFRVQPLGLATDPKGNQVFALRIDYLTLWNADGGLIGGGPACLYSYVGLDGVVGQLSGHFFDAERSGMLVAAPAVNGGYNPDPTA
jgi:hypothetical protein